MLEKEGKQYTHFYSVLRFLGKKYGYYPQDDKMTCYQIDTILEAIKDPYSRFLKYCEAYDKKANTKALYKLTQYLTHTTLKVLNEKLKHKENKTFIIGSNLTIADFALFGFLKACVFNKSHSGVFAGIINQYEEITNYTELIHAYLKETIQKITTTFTFLKIYN